MAPTDSEQKTGLLEDYPDQETSFQHSEPQVQSRFITIRVKLRNYLLEQQSSSRPKAVFIATFSCLLPSFIHVHSPKSEAGQKKLSSTAWLDGLRGVAAFFVVFTHYFHLFLPFLEAAWNIDSPNRSILQLPLIRIFHSGTGMVAVFFIISGYVLSYKALQLIRLDEPIALHNSLASSTFRRAARLFLPIIASTFFAMLFGYFNWFGQGIGSRAPPRLPTFGGNVVFWAKETLTVTDPFRVISEGGVYNPVYDANLWTIPVEFRGSIIVFLVVLGLARVKPRLRVIILLAMVVYCFWRLHTEFSLFLAGVLFADLHHFIHFHFHPNYLQLDKSCSNPQGNGEDVDEANIASRTKKIALEILKKTASILLFLLSIFFLGMPYSDIDNSPCYWVLADLTPPNYASIDALAQIFWINTGGCLCVLTLDNALFLQSIFTTRIAQYLGRISYALYLVHGTLLYTLGWHMIPAFVAADEKSVIKSFFGHLIGGGLLFVIIIWIADLFSRAVDEKSVVFVRYISQRSFIKR